MCGRSDCRMAPSRIRARNWICSRCANAARDRDAGRYLARKLAAVLRKRGVRPPYPGVQFARAVLRKYGDHDDLRRRCIVRVDESGPWTVDNAVLVSSAEAHALTTVRLRNTCDLKLCK